MWAVVEISKKQYIVKKGDLIEVERLKEKEGDVVFDKVLLLVDKKKVHIGAPYIEGAAIKASLQGEKKTKKVIVYKVKRRKKYRVKQGHRQIKAILKISSITLGA
ncbi:MAG: 50S ribosomal protein L21 [Candidatus Omnitrophica bacterium]|nr:50S ribosomal protein L21 [Candidatus Omnitrophota bacterium]